MTGKIDKIFDGLYIGNHYDALDQDTIDRYEIKTVINCTKKDERINMAIDYLQIPLDDPPTEKDTLLLNKTFYPSVLFIDNSINSGKNVLVHCKIGSQRAATIIAMYLMIKHSTNYDDAISFIQSVRPIAFFGTIVYLESLKFVQNKVIQSNNGTINKGKILSKILNNKKPNVNPFAHRKHVYDENKFLCLEGKLKVIPSIPSIKISFNNSLLPIPLYEPATIQILDMDSLQIAKMLIDNEYKPLVLNIGNSSAPCGNTFCHENIIDAQEEILICRTNYFKTLTVESGVYPNDGPDGIYSPQVLVFRNEDLDIIEKPYYVSFVASSPVPEPTLMNGRMTDEDYNLTFAKIDTIFQIGMSKGFDSIVLGAFGCDNLYNNPVYQIVGIFNKCLQRWKNSFKVITFAIPSIERIHGANYNKNTVCNYEFFKKYITV